MNLSAAILAILTLLVTIQPPMIAFSGKQFTIKQISCKNKCAKKIPVKNDHKKLPPGCDDCVCNPLGPLCCCIVTEKPAGSRNEMYIKKDKIILFDDDVFSSYSAKVWQPPEAI